MFITIIITWYSKQKYNNPFTPCSNIQIGGSDGQVYIRCFNKIKHSEENVLLFLLPDYLLIKSNAASLDLSEIPTLVTMDMQENIYRRLKTPPSSWIILNDSLTNDDLPAVPQQWPTPSFSGSISDTEKIKIYYMYPFSDTVPSIHFTYNNIDIIIISEFKELTDSNRESIFKEKYDVVIIHSVDNMPVMKIRELLRPHYLVITHPIHKSNSMQTTTNIIQPDSSSFSYTLSKDKKNKMYIKKER